MLRRFYTTRRANIDGNPAQLAPSRAECVMLTSLRSALQSRIRDSRRLHQYNRKASLCSAPVQPVWRAEPGTNSEIKKFCARRFTSRFRSSKKSTSTARLATRLCRARWQWLGSAPVNVKWNSKNFSSGLPDGARRSLRYAPDAPIDQPSRPRSARNSRLCFCRPIPSCHCPPCKRPAGPFARQFVFYL